MGIEYGRNVIADTGIPIYTAVDAQNVEYKAGGVTVDWSTVAALGADTKFPEGFTVKNGQKALRFGQVLTRITKANVQTLTVSGTPTGGTFVISGYRIDTGAYVVTAAIAYNATAATVLAALQAVGVFGPTFPITVSGSAGGPYTITTPLALLTGDGSGLTGGTTPAATVVMTTPGGNYGQYGPYDPGASDGRQTLTIGEVVVINTSVVENGLLNLGAPKLTTNHPGAITGGQVWKARLIANSSANSLAAGPTFANLLAAMPRLVLAGQNP